jgi:hypothetical protein
MTIYEPDANEIQVPSLRRGMTNGGQVRPGGASVMPVTSGFRGLPDKL